jgi:hypothetical protein
MGRSRGMTYDLYWCDGCVNFVDENHKCQQWQSVTIVKRSAYDTIRAEARAEALKEAADRAVNLVKLIRSADCFDELTDDHLRAAIKQEKPC